MSRLDTIEQRLSALEAGGDLAQRLAAIEEVLGLSSAATPTTRLGGTRHCDRCGMDQAREFKCNQTKCPLAS